MPDKPHSSLPFFAFCILVSMLRFDPMLIASGVSYLQHSVLMLPVRKVSGKLRLYVPSHEPSSSFG